MSIALGRRGVCKLIGIRSHIQCRTNLIGVKPAVLQKLCLPRPLPEVRRRRRAEALGPDLGRKRGPVAQRIRESRAHAAVIDAALNELAAYAHGPLTLTRPRTNETLDEPVLIEQAVPRKAIEHLRDNGRLKAARTELALELPTAVFAACEQIHRPEAAGAPRIRGLEIRLRPA